MASWKKVLTRGSAVDATTGLLYTVTAASAEGATLTLSDGTNTDDIAIVAGAGIDFASTSESGFTIQVDTSEITSAIQGELTDALLQASGNASAVTLTLTGPGGETDTVALTGGTGINFASVTAGGFTIETTEEDIEDIVGGMLGGTETGITVTYQDTTNDIDFVVADQTLTSATSNTNNVTLSMSNPSGTADTVEIVAGTGITLTNNSDGQFTITNSISDTTLTEEEVEDIVGGMLGGTETGITVTYNDTDNDIDFVVADQTLQSSTSNTDNITLTMSNPTTDDTVEIVAGTGITLTNNSAGQFTIDSSGEANPDVADSNNASAFVLFHETATGTLAPKTDTTLKYNASTQTLTVKNLTVNGTTTTVDTTNLLVSDQFIYLNDSGNAANVDADAGFVVEGLTKSVAFGYHQSDDRFVFDKTGATSGMTSIDPDAFFTHVHTNTAVPTDGTNGADSDFAQIGNLYVNSTNEDIYIYS